MIILLVFSSRFTRIELYCFPYFSNKSNEKVKIIIVPSITHYMFLGMDFLKIYQIDVNFNFYYSLRYARLKLFNHSSTYPLLKKYDLEPVIKLITSIAPDDSLGCTHLTSHSMETACLAEPVSFITIIIRQARAPKQGDTDVEGHRNPQSP